MNNVMDAQPVREIYKVGITNPSVADPVDNRGKFLADLDHFMDGHPEISTEARDALLNVMREAYDRNVSQGHGIYECYEFSIDSRYSHLCTKYHIYWFEMKIRFTSQFERSHAISLHGPLSLD